MLSGPEQLQWRDALFNAFSDQEFTDLLWHRLGERIGRYASATKPWEAVVGDVVDAYSRRDQEDFLIARAVEARPRNVDLLRMASTKRAAVAPDDASLERLIQRTNSFLDLGTWLERAGTFQVCVCRIEISAQGGGKIFGTGFLIAADLVMTNWHVVQCIAATEDNDGSYQGPRAKAGDAVCRFDYKVLINGAVNQGSTGQLAKDWKVALSPNNPNVRAPLTDELDCAVIRLAKAVGECVVGDKQEAQGELRSWIRLPSAEATPDFRPHAPLFIIQHPEGDPIKLALDTDAIVSVNANRTRVLYSTNTDRGSSGSPCFDQNWNLVALHHGGGPAVTPTHRSEFNEGIPIDTIVKFLSKHGLGLPGGSATTP